MTELSPLWAGATDDRISTEELEAWVRAQGLADVVWFAEGPQLPTDPGAGIVVTWLAGPGFSLEQMLDTPAFQVRVIGPQSNPDEARILATMLDRAFTRYSWPAMIGGRYVVEIRRAGGKPSLDRIDDANRTHYVCTYLADVEAD